MYPKQIVVPETNTMDQVLLQIPTNVNQDVTRIDKYLFLFATQ